MISEAVAVYKAGHFAVDCKFSTELERKLRQLPHSHIIANYALRRLPHSLT